MERSERCEELLTLATTGRGLPLLAVEDVDATLLAPFARVPRGSAVRREAMVGGGERKWKRGAVAQRQDANQLRRVVSRDGVGNMP